MNFTLGKLKGEYMFKIAPLVGERELGPPAQCKELLHVAQFNLLLFY